MSEAIEHADAVGCSGEDGQKAADIGKESANGGREEATESAAAFHDASDGPEGEEHDGGGFKKEGDDAANTVAQAIELRNKIKSDDHSGGIEDARTEPEECEDAETGINGAGLIVSEERHRGSPVASVTGSMIL